MKSQNLWSEKSQNRMRGKRHMKMESEWKSERMWLTSVSQLQPLVVWICIQSGTSKAQQLRQTMARWLIRCVRLLLEKVSEEIKHHFEHPTGVYWKGAGMLRMSAVWVCPWMKGAHKMRSQAAIEPDRVDAESPYFSIVLHRRNNKKIVMHASIKWIRKSHKDQQTLNLHLNYYRHHPLQPLLCTTVGH